MSEEAKYTTTLKAGAGYDTPWVVIRSDNTEELVEDLDNLTEEVLQKVNDVASLFQGSRVVAAGSASAAPDATVTQTPANGVGKTCNHGVRTRREGVSSRGAWVGWFCPQPKGSADQCKAIFE